MACRLVMKAEIERWRIVWEDAQNSLISPAYTTPAPLHVGQMGSLPSLSLVPSPIHLLQVTYGTGKNSWPVPPQTEHFGFRPSLSLVPVPWHRPQSMSCFGIAPPFLSRLSDRVLTPTRPAHLIGASRYSLIQNASAWLFLLGDCAQ